MQMESWVGKPTTARVTGDFFYDVESPADPAVERMENERVFKRKVMLSWVALIEAPGCIEAHLFMGTCAKDPDLRMRHLEAAVSTGHGLWDPVAKAEGEDMTWWGFAATRPYMRATKALGLEHHSRGDVRAARDCFETLVEMNPNDNQGVRAAIEVMDAVPPRGCRLILPHHTLAAELRDYAAAFSRLFLNDFLTILFG